MIQFHNMRYSSSNSQGIPITSLIIPSFGIEYIEESKLSAFFADKNFRNLKEIIIVSDQDISLFNKLPNKTRVVTIKITEKLFGTNSSYKRVYFSRIVKIQAPLYATTKGVLMIDSDLNLLKHPDIILNDNNVYTSFRKCNMIDKLSLLSDKKISQHYINSYRIKDKYHVNSAFMAATYSTWEKICPLWKTEYSCIWKENKNYDLSPIDQLPLVIVLEKLNIYSVNIGEWYNWPVSKNIGGILSCIPKKVIGAHGGFPLSEWIKYLEYPNAMLLFKNSDYTRQVRYFKKM